MAEKKTCFVIGPIGEEGSEIRARSDKVLKHIITPPAKECGYEPVRADAISEAGIITSQIIERLMEDDLVIADLSHQNPNVFYELALRHVFRKPVVLMIDNDQEIPFDISAARIIPVDYRDLDSVEEAKAELTKQIKAIEENSGDVDTPVSMAVDLKELRASKNPVAKSNAEIIERLQDIRMFMEKDGSGVLGTDLMEECREMIDRVAAIRSIAAEIRLREGAYEQECGGIARQCRAVDRWLLVLMGSVTRAPHSARRVTPHERPS